MKQGYLVYILITLIVLFLVTVGYDTWRNKPATAKKNNIDTNQTDTPIIPQVSKYEVPILMYHYIRVAPEGDTLGQNLSVTPDNFRTQMKWLNENNYLTIRTEDLADPYLTVISNVAAKNKKPIIITFDDGYDDAFTAAYPVLKENDFIGTFYIIRNYVGRTNYMNQTQIDEMADNNMEIGSHSLNHPDLAKSSEVIQHKQIFDSKLFATTFCFPSGKFNNTTISLIKEAGYTTAVTTKEGIANQDSNLLELPRVRMTDGGVELIKNKIETAKK